MATDQEKAEFFTGVLNNLERIAKDQGRSPQEFIVVYSKSLQPNGLPEFYKIEQKD